ncbi:MAG: HAD family phosphatase [Bifidobacteriaceae bacterium]|jgi:HAD superfamily hydrolase (TIGR01509 family)|nr:HAD family phosphatase [Bifidobacteriaceae bacterium]
MIREDFRSLVPAAVLWDLDGTLVDSEEYWIEGEFALVNQHRGMWSREDALAMVGNDLTRTGQTLREHGVDMEVPEIVQFLLANVIARMRERVPWRPGAESLLAQCRDRAVPCALVTASYRDYAEAVVDVLPRGSFAAIVPGEEVSAGKPDPEGYLRAADVLGAERNHCVILEDSHTGVQAAINSGMPAVAIPFLVEVPDAPTLSRVGSLEELNVDILGQIAHGRVLRTV